MKGLKLEEKKIGRILGGEFWRRSGTVRRENFFLLLQLWETCLSGITSDSNRAFYEERRNERVEMEEKKIGRILGGEVERFGEKIFFFFNCGRLVYLGLHPIQTVFYEERKG